MNQSQFWKGRPLFVSSTFRDFQEERDHLQRVVFPELSERLRARRLHLEPIDLRWGVDTVSLTDDSAREALVLKVCLEHIRLSKPFLLVLLGDRYGWVPEPHPGLPVEWQPVGRAVREAGYTGPTEGRSVTALEIEYGVLAAPEQQVNTRFLFRRLDYGEMPDSLRRHFDDRSRCEQLRHELDRETDEQRRRALTAGLGAASHATTALDALKQRIREKMPGRWHEYDARWVRNGERGAIRREDLEYFGRLVLDALWQELDRTSQDRVALPAIGWQQEEREAFSTFVANVTRDFHGRETLLDELAELALGSSDENSGACVTGEPGSGKSAFLAKLSQVLQRPKDDRPAPLVLTHAAGISPHSARVDRLVLRWCHELAASLEEAAPFPEEPRPNSQELDDAFADLLARTSRGRRVVILVDGLNQFERSARAEYLGWLPREWPPNVKLIATSLPGVWVEAFRRRSGFSLRTIGALTEADARLITAAVCDRYHRALNPEVLQAVLARRSPAPVGASAAPVYGNPLWLNLAVEELNLLDADDFSRADRPHGADGTPFDPGAALHRLLVETATALPPTVPTLYDRLLSRAEKVAGPALARAFTTLIAVSRTGLRDSDLEHLLPAVSGEPFDFLRLGILRRTFRSHLVRRGEVPLWDFFHTQMREAVARRCLSDGAAPALHDLIATHLESEAVPTDDPVRVGELMVHLIGSGDRLRAVHYYAGVRDGSPEHRAATQAIADHMRGGPAALDWVCSLLDTNGLTTDEAGRVCANFAHELHDLLTPEGRWQERKRLLEATLARWRRSDGKSPVEELRAQMEQGRILGRLGDLAVQEGDADGAATLYWQASEINRRLLGLQRGADGGQPDEMLGIEPTSGEPADAAEMNVQLHVLKNEYVICERLGDLLALQGNREQARHFYEGQIQGLRWLCKVEPASPVNRINLTAALHKLGILAQHDDLPGARKLYSEALDVWRQLGGNGPQPRTQQGTASTWSLLGGVALAQGQTDEARRCFHESVNLIRKSSDRFPGDPEGEMILINSLKYLGGLARQEGRTRDAEIAYRERLERARALLRLLPRDAKAVLLLAEALRAVGELAGQTDDDDRQAACDEEALPLYRSLGVSGLFQDTGLACQIESLRRLAGRSERAGNLQLAEAYNRECLAACRKFEARKPDLFAPVEHHLLIADWLGDRTSGDPGEALCWYLTAIQDARWLIERSTEKEQVRRVLGLLLIAVGDLGLGRGQWDLVHSVYRESLAIRREAVRATPGEAQRIHELAVILERMGVLAGQQKEWDRARRHHEEALAARRMLARVLPQVAQFGHTVAISLNFLTQLEENAGDLVRAEGHRRDCYETLQHLVRCGQLENGPLNELLRELRQRFAGEGAVNNG